MKIVFIAALLALTTAACTHVAPYERGKLANPTMNDSVAAGPAAEHVYSVHEGATGGGGVGGAGCGCN